MARTAKITNANVAPSKNAAGLVGNTPVRAQDFNDLVGDYVSKTDSADQAITGGVAAGLTVGSFIVGLVPDAAIETIAAGNPGAISVACYFTSVATDGDVDAFTLADGTVKGQLKKIHMGADGGGNATITIASPVSASLDLITMADAGDQVELIWNGTAWRIIAASGAVDVGPSIA